MRLIDADALPKYTGYALSADEVAKAVENAPTVDAVSLEDYKSMENTINKLTKAIADAEPVKHGHWIFNPKDAIEMMFTLPKCSECGAESADGGNYCTNCGAKMDEVKDEQ